MGVLIRFLAAVIAAISVADNSVCRLAADEPIPKPPASDVKAPGPAASVTAKVEESVREIGLLEARNQGWYSQRKAEAMGG